MWRCLCRRGTGAWSAERWREISIRTARSSRRMSRRVGSARALGLSESLREDEVRAAVVEAVSRSGVGAGGRARVRVTVTGGDLNLLGKSQIATRQMADEGHRPTVMVAAQGAMDY